MRPDVKNKLISMNLLFILLLTFLAGCGNLKDSSISSNDSTAKQEQQTRTTWQVTGSMYQSMLENGRYKTSSLTGLTDSSEGSNPMNMKNFQLGLLNLSMQKFPTKDYIFREGQQIDLETAQSWIKRKSKTNPAGLNPEDNGQKDPNKRSPYYLQSISEEDFMKQSGKSFSLGGMSIGLSMNSIDYYTKEQYGAELQTKISDDTIKEQGQKDAQEILTRLRKEKKTADTPILFGIFKQAPKDSMNGGYFLEYAYSGEGSKKIDKWIKINEENVSFPKIDNEKVPNDSDANSFQRFKSSVERFFPTASGITAQAHYLDGSLDNLDITVNTQFTSETEVMSFTQFVSGEASRYLPKGVSIEISIVSTNKIQAFTARNGGDDGFYSHLFTGQNL